MRFRRKKIKLGANGSRGQALVEFALMLPLILLLVGGLTDLGVAFYLSIGVHNAVREGARIAVTMPQLTANDGTVDAAVTDRVPNVGSIFSLDSVTNTAPSSLTCDANVEVQANGTYSFTFLRLVGFTTMTISESATMRYELSPEPQRLCL